MAKQKKPEFQKTRTGRFRLGLRLNSIFWPLDVPSIAQILDKLGYKNIQTTANGSLQGSKTSSDFYSDYSKMVFGFYASTSDSLISAEKEFFASAKNEFKANLHQYIRFYEIENILTYYTDNEKNTVSEIFSDSKDMLEFSKLIGEDASLSKVDISKKGAMTQTDDYFHVEISPKLESASNAYHCRFLKRSKNHDEIIKTLRKSTDILENFASYVEQKNK